MAKPAITVYVVSRDYGRYLGQAVESVLAQTRTDWELIVIDDGSTDDSAAVAASFQDRDPDRIRLVAHPQPRGLQACANEALRLARGRYIMRLDADDYLDESALLVLAHCLDTHPDVALAYPNYVYVDERGNHLGVEHHRRIGQESTVLDQPAHGACTLVRKRVLKTVGGYDEANDRQDGYELWLKVVNRYKVMDVPTPLFYYRQHAQSLSHDRSELLAARARIKRAQVERHGGPVQPRCVAVIGAKNSYGSMPNVVLAPLAGKPLIDYTLDQAIATGAFERIVVTTDDAAVVDYCRERYPEALAYVRPAALSATGTAERAVLADALESAEREDLWPDIVVALSLHTPLCRPEHIRKAIDTLMLYDVDTVISVHEDQDLYYVHGAKGLEPVNPAMHRQVRVEREALYVSNGAVHVYWRDVLSEPAGRELTVGHIIMPRGDSFQIKTPQDAWLVEQMLLAGSGSRLPEAWQKAKAR